MSHRGLKILNMKEAITNIIQTAVISTIRNTVRKYIRRKLYFSYIYHYIDKTCIYTSSVAMPEEEQMKQIMYHAVRVRSLTKKVRVQS